VESKKLKRDKEKHDIKKEVNKNIIKPQIRRKAPVKGKKSTTETNL